MGGEGVEVAPFYSLPGARDLDGPPLHARLAQGLDRAVDLLRPNGD